VEYLQTQGGGVDVEVLREAHLLSEGVFVEVDDDSQ
jgi:hypothetical protein